MDIHQFFLGNSFDAHTYFGAHVTEEGVVFRTLAPNAAAVDLIWEGGEWEPMPMKKVHDGGVYELTVPEAVPGQMYKYRITPQNPDGDVIDHCDPYGSGWSCVPTTPRSSVTCPATPFTTRNGWHSVATTGTSPSISTRCIWVPGAPTKRSQRLVHL